MTPKAPTRRPITTANMALHRDAVIGYLRNRAQDCAIEAEQLKIRGLQRSAILTAGELISDLADSLEDS